MRGGPPGTSGRFAVHLLLLSVSAALAYAYLRLVGLPNLELRIDLHAQILAGSAPAPYRFRALVPFIAELLWRALALVLDREHAFLLSYALSDFLCIALLVETLYWWLTCWFPRGQSLIGVLFVAGILPIALLDHYYQPWSLLEPGILAASLLAAHRRRSGLLVLLVALASLNRETAVLIPLAVLLLTVERAGDAGAGGVPRRRWVALFAGLIGVWALCFFALRLILGNAEPVLEPGAIFELNTRPLSVFLATLHVALFFGGFWILVLVGFSSAPKTIKRLALLIPPYLLAVLIWGRWHEVRLLMPLYPILLPIGLGALGGLDARSGPAGGARSERVPRDDPGA